MVVERDDVLIRGTIEVLRDIESRMGENELLNAVAREARILIKCGESLLVNSNPHVADHEKFISWAQDCADLSDYINATALQH